MRQERASFTPHKSGYIVARQSGYCTRPLCELIFLCERTQTPSYLPSRVQRSRDFAASPETGTRTHFHGAQRSARFRLRDWHVENTLIAALASANRFQYLSRIRGHHDRPKIRDGRANLVELKADGPAGHFEGLSLRLYSPQSHQWNLNFAGVGGGTLSQPTVGEIKNGRGQFFDQETLNGRAILVRFFISDITSNSWRFEQSFSDDGGKAWEVNWIATDTRVTDESDKVH